MKTKFIRKPSTFEGLPLVDANEPLIISIEPKDISGAKKNSPENCAAARAIERELKTEARVFIGRIYVKKNKQWVRFLTPIGIAREITSFDRGSSFEPGEFVINPLPPSSRLGICKGKSTETGKGNKRHIRHITVNIRPGAKLSKTRKNGK